MELGQKKKICKKAANIVDSFVRSFDPGRTCYQSVVLRNMQMDRTGLIGLDDGEKQDLPQGRIKESINRHKRVKKGGLNEQRRGARRAIIGCDQMSTSDGENSFVGGN